MRLGFQDFEIGQKRGVVFEMGLKLPQDRMDRDGVATDRFPKQLPIEANNFSNLDVHIDGM